MKAFDRIMLPALRGSMVWFITWACGAFVMNNVVFMVVAVIPAILSAVTGLICIVIEAAWG